MATHTKGRRGERVSFAEKEVDDFRAERELLRYEKEKRGKGGFLVVFWGV